MNHEQTASGFGAGAIMGAAQQNLIRRPGEIERELGMIDNLISRIATNEKTLRDRIGSVCGKPQPSIGKADDRTDRIAATEPATQSDLGERLAGFRRQLEMIQRSICDTTDSIVL